MTPTTDRLALTDIASSSLPLTGEWRFATDPDKAGEGEEWFSLSYDDSTWVTVSVPHTWNVMREYLDY